MEIGKIKSVSFDEYKKSLIEPENKRSEKSAEEIMAEMLPVIAAHEKRQ